jgi:hypothetical protein
MPSLIPLRAAIADGDLRTLYLGWLHCAGVGELDDEAIEPPVPPGLVSLSAPTKAIFASLAGVTSQVIPPSSRR